MLCIDLQSTRCCILLERSKSTYINPRDILLTSNLVIPVVLYSTGMVLYYTVI